MAKVSQGKSDYSHVDSRLRRAYKILQGDSNIGGPLAAAEHLAWLLFLRFLDQEEKRLVSVGGKRGEKYVPILDGYLSWDYWASDEALQKWDIQNGELTTFVRTRLFPGLASLSGSPLADAVRGIFSDDDRGGTAVRNVVLCASDYHLKEVISVINSINFSHEEDFFTLGRFYEELLARMGQENQSAGEFYTPRPVIRFAVDVIDPRPGETVYDPACGSAGFLVEAYLHMKKRARSKYEEEKLQENTFYGQEKKGVPVLLGTMNMILHGVRYPKIVRANTLEENVCGEVKRRYDVVLANPPFGGIEPEYVRNNFPVQTGATELMFFQHIMRKIAPTPNGRAAVIMPEGFLFRSGAYASVKEMLMSEFHLFAVISLPSGVFAPYSDVKTSLLFFRRVEETMSKNALALGETWYYELAAPEGGRFGKGNPIRDEYFDEARRMWALWQAWIDGKGNRPFPFASEVRGHQREREDGNNRWGTFRNAWVEKLEDIRDRGYDLRARNPYQDDIEELPPPVEITARMLERFRTLQERLERLHRLVGSTWEE